MKPLPRSALTQKAKEMGLKGLSNMSKPDIIHALQVAEGNVPCFQRIPDCGNPGLPLSQRVHQVERNKGLNSAPYLFGTKCPSE